MEACRPVSDLANVLVGTRWSSSSCHTPDISRGRKETYIKDANSSSTSEIERET